jgi:hypothetical protein
MMPEPLCLLVSLKGGGNAVRADPARSVVASGAGRAADRVVADGYPPAGVGGFGDAGCWLALLVS